jgi:hypothetical protein
MSDGEADSRTLRIDLPIEETEIPILRGALLAARATETAELQRRGYRLSTGYGTDSARAGISAEVDRLRRRIELLDRVIAALRDEADSGPG